MTTPEQWAVPGGRVRIDVDALPPAARGELRWFLPPKVLRNIR